VQPGNSGSPLLDVSGAVAGVVVAKLNGLRCAS
jgi:S1-C subfamily serine protease